MLAIMLSLVLASTPAAPAPAQRANVAILLFDGVQVIDYSGPYEVFMETIGKGGPAFHVYTVAQKEGLVTAAGGLRVMPDYTFANAPKADILVIPGGGTHRAAQGVGAVMASADALAWVKQSAAGAQTVLSVCNGAFVLAKAGLLDNLEATTTSFVIDELKTLSPTTKTSRRRFADNGKIVTAGGLSAGIDAAFHVIEKREGRATAQLVARAMEYHWDPEATYSAAELADAPLFTALGPLVFGLNGTPLLYSADKNRSEARVRLAGASAAQVFGILDKAFQSWKQEAAGEDGRRFTKGDLAMQMTLQPAGDALLVTLNVTRSARRE